jgi:hypothetical protein
MNPEQMARQIRHELEQATWPAGSQSLVFGVNGRVKIYADTPTEDQIPPMFPACMVGINGGVPDRDQPAYIKQNFTVTALSMIAGDPMGENAVVGGGTADVGTSAGKGVMELAERVRFVLQNVMGATGTKVHMHVSSTETPVSIGGRHLVANDTGIEAMCTSDLYYAPPQQVAYSGSSWTWVGENHCRGRHDFVSYALAYIVGSTPSSLFSDYTQVGASVGTEAITHTPVSGRTYCVFAEYNRHGKSGETTIVGRSRGDRVGAYRVIP